MAYKKTIVLGLDYSEFSGGITECNNKMKLLDNEFALAQSQMDLTGSASDKLATQEEFLTQKINLQRQKVELAKEKYNALMDAHADTSKIDKADSALLNERTTLQKLQNELDETKLKASGLKETLVACTTVIVSIGAAYYKAAEGAAEYADEILTLSNNTGISTEKIQELEYASNLVDVSVETMTGSMEKLIKSMSTASKGTGEAAEAFKTLRVKFKEANGTMRDSEDVFYDVIDALGKVKNKTEQDQLAMALFGESAQDLSGIILAGSEGMKAYGEEAKKLGIIMGEEDLKKAGELQDALDKMHGAFEALSNSVGLTVVPILTALFETIASIPVPVLKTITIILSVVTTLVILGKTINTIADATSGVSNLLKILGGGMDATVLKITAIVVALTALASIIAVIIGKGSELQSTMNSIGNYSAQAQSGKKTGHNARGTSNWSGGRTWVGEEGPEIVDLPPGSRIYNNQESKSITGDTNVFYVNVDASSIEDVQRMMNVFNGIKQSRGRGGKVNG